MTTSGPLKRDLSWWTRLGGSLWRDIELWVRSEPLVVVMMVLFGAVLGLAVNRLVGPRKYHAWGGVTVEAGGSGIELPSILANLAAGSGLRLGGSSYPLAFQTSLMDSPGFQDSVLLDSLGAVTPTGCPANSPCFLRDFFSSPKTPVVQRLKSARKRPAAPSASSGTNEAGSSWSPAMRPSELSPPPPLSRPTSGSWTESTAA